MGIEGGNTAVKVGAKILIVEDESLIAMLVEDMLIELGYDVVGIAATVSEGEVIVATKRVDAAILDVSLHGEKSFPIAQALTQREIPFVFSSGYDSREIEANYSTRPLLRKPFILSELERVLAAL